MKTCLVLLVTIGLRSFSGAALTGPFLLWGHASLQGLQQSALSGVDEESLASLFTAPKAVMVFLRDSNNRLDSMNFPSLRTMIYKNFWSYLPQHTLAAEPFVHNSNVQVINLMGPSSQQDAEIAAVFKDAVTMHGNDKVLGVLAYREKQQEEDDHHYHKYKREANVKPLTTEQSTQSGFIYRAPHKAMLYTTSAPVIHMHIQGHQHSYALLEHDKEVTFDDHIERGHLNVGFRLNSTRLRLRFNFTMSASQYWSLSSVEVEYKEYHNLMPLVGPEIVAPKGFSYRCSTRSLFFRNEADNLTINDFQLQPWLGDENRFGNAYDCVGFITIPIWSGLFVSGMLVSLLFIGVLALIDIKPSVRMESGKQLDLASQE